MIRKNCNKLDKGHLISPEWKFSLKLFNFEFVESAYNGKFLLYLISLVLKVIALVERLMSMATISGIPLILLSLTTKALYYNLPISTFSLD